MRNLRSANRSSAAQGTAPTDNGRYTLLADTVPYLWLHTNSSVRSWLAARTGTMAPAGKRSVRQSCRSRVHSWLARCRERFRLRLAFAVHARVDDCTDRECTVRG